MGFAGGRTSASVTLQIHDNLLTMTSKNKFNIEQDFYVDEIDIKNIDNIKNEIILHTKYFLDGIMSSSEEDVVLNIAKNNNIFITENDRRILLLPMLR
jgi:DNA polymerase III sliding clamp (beta) subunit (PCNA family)